MENLDFLVRDRTVPCMKENPPEKGKTTILKHAQANSGLTPGEDVDFENSGGKMNGGNVFESNLLLHWIGKGEMQDGKEGPASTERFLSDIRR